MSSSIWKYSLRQAKLRGLRTALTLAGIVVGVATIVAVSLATHTMRGAYGSMFESLVGRASIEINADAGAAFDEQLTGRLAENALVSDCVGVIHTAGVMVTETGPMATMIMGIDPVRDVAIRDYELAKGRFLDAQDGVLITVDSARSYDLELGDMLTIGVATGTHKLPITGILAPSGAARFNGGRIAFIRLTTSRRILAIPAGKINAAHVATRPEIAVETAITQINQILPTGIRAHSQSPAADVARDAFLNLEQILAVLSIVSLISGGAVILNTMQMNLGERRKHLAILRALGATPRQITRLVVNEGLIFGLLGTVIGIAAGAGLAAGLVPGMERAMGTDIANLRWTWEPFILAIVLGPGLAMAASYVPARRAGRRNVIDDLSEKAVDSRRFARLPALTGLAMLASAVAIDALFVGRLLDPTLGRALLPIANALLLIGALLALPLFLPSLLPAASWVMRKFFGVEGRLAAKQLQRHQLRTMLTCGVLVIAINVSVGPGNAIVNATQNLYQWLDRVAGADFFVEAAASNDLGFLTAASIPESHAEALAEIGGVARVDKVNWFPLQVQGTTALLISSTYSPERPERINATRDSPEDLVQRMIDGQAAIGTMLADRLNLSIGDEIDVVTLSTSSRLRIAGKSMQYHAGGMTLHLHHDQAKRIFDLNGVHLLSIDVESGHAPQVAQQLQEYCRKNGLRMMSFLDLRNEVEERVLGTNGFLWVMMALVFIVAALGIVNTLTINVLEQTREIGVLRAIGMRRRQVFKMVIAQAVGFATISFIPGILMGLVTALMMNIAQEPLSGHYIEFQLRWQLVIGSSALALAAVLLASWLPSRRAATVPIASVLQYE